MLAVLTDGNRNALLWICKCLLPFLSFSSAFKCHLSRKIFPDYFIKIVILPMPNPRAPHSITLYYFSPYHTLPPDILYTYMCVCIYIYIFFFNCMTSLTRMSAPWGYNFFFFNPLLYTQPLQESQAYKRFSICGKWKSEWVKEWMNIKSLKNVHGISPNLFLRIHAR